MKNVKLLIKKYSSFHSQGNKKNILLFSSPRSGSTWMKEIVATQPSFKMVSEPFNIRIPHKREVLGIDRWEDFYQPDATEKIERYMRMFINGNDRDIRFQRPAPFSEFWRPMTSRIVFKILFAGEHNMNWFKDQFNGHVLFLVRHPIPVALSRKELPRLHAFLHTSFSTNFSTEQIRFGRKIQEHGSSFEKAVLDWCLQNAIALRKMDKDWIVVSYEQMVLNLPLVVDHLVAKCGFEQPHRMLERLYRASGSTGQSDAKSQAVLLDPKKLAASRHWLIEKWVDKVSDKQRQTASEILSLFEIDFYRTDNALPLERYLLRSADA